MNDSPYRRYLPITGITFLALAGGYVSAQQPWGPPGGMPPMEEAVPLPEPKVSIEEKDGFRHITSNGVPNHEVGKFPNPGNPNAIRAQTYKFKATLKPQPAAQKSPVRHDLFGVAVSGVPFDPATGEFWNNDRRWNYDALSGKLNLGMDMNNAHVQPGGVYHYHGLPNALIAKINKKDQMVLVGWAADGYPVYAAHGYATADNAKSGIKKLRPSYKLKPGTRPSGTEGPGGAYDGTFSVDWEYVADSGDLDEYNGRTGVTPEFPQGTYYYVLTDTYPFVPRYFKGTPDASFTKPRPQGGQRPGGPGGPGGQGGPPGQGGWGPPPGGGPGGGPPQGPPPGWGPPPPPPGWGPPGPGF